MATASPRIINITFTVRRRAPLRFVEVDGTERRMDYSVGTCPRTDQKRMTICLALQEPLDVLRGALLLLNEVHAAMFCNIPV